MEHKGVVFQVKKKIETPAKKPNIIRAPRTPEDFMAIAKAKDYKVGWVALKSLELAKSYEDCVHIAEVCGYKKGWAWHQWEDLKKKFPSLKDPPRYTFRQL